MTTNERMTLGDPTRQTGPNRASTLEMPGGGERMASTPRRIGPPAGVVPDVHTPLHVTSCEDGWQLKFEGVATPVAVYPTKKQAMKQARAMASAHDCRLIEHLSDGRIR